MGHLEWVIIHSDRCPYKKNFRNRDTKDVCTEEKNYVRTH